MRRLLLACATLGSACVTPPAVLAPLPVVDRLEIPVWPPDTQEVALRLDGGLRLRGRFVPSDPGAPLVLHLLGAGGSATEGNFTRELFWQLADRGFASLVLDYRGVGASEGSRSPTHLVEDARAAYAEALRRVDGDERRLALRCTSLGSLAGAALLAEGARPAAVSLWAPVRAETIVRNYARALLGPLGALLALVVDVPVPVDLARTLAAVELPLFVVLGERDLFLPAQERRALGSALSASRAPLELVVADETHMGLVYDSFRLSADEERFLRAHVPPRPALEERLPPLRAALERVLLRTPSAPPAAAFERELLTLASRRRGDPPELAAQALVALRSADLADRWLALTRRELGARHDARGLRRMRQVLSLEDPGGRLPPELVVEWSEALSGSLFKQQDATGWTVDRLPRPEPAEVVSLLEGFATHGAAAEDPPLVLRLRVALSEPGRATTFEQRVEGFWPAGELWRRLAEAGFAPEDRYRALVRIWLKALFVPERVRIAADGRALLEVQERDGWRALELESRGASAGP